MDYEYFINLDERGEFQADVRDESGKTVFEINGFEIFEDGFMSYDKDLPNLYDHLRDLNILGPDDRLFAGNWS